MATYSGNPPPQHHPARPRPASSASLQLALRRITSKLPASLAVQQVGQLRQRLVHFLLVERRLRQLGPAASLGVIVLNPCLRLQHRPPLLAAAYSEPVPLEATRAQLQHQAAEFSVVGSSQASHPQLVASPLDRLLLRTPAVPRQRIAHSRPRINQRLLRAVSMPLAAQVNPLAQVVCFL